MQRAATNGHSPKDQYDLIAELIEAARQYVPRERGEDLFRKWLPRRDKDVEGLSEKRMFAMTADAILLAGDLLLSQPSGSGSTAFDRLAKNRARALTLDDIARGLDDAMRRLALPLRVKTLFETLRARVTGARRADDPGLERLMQRIQALRAKTIAHGCTEQEALAAAEKVAELLDRHGLSLNELEFKAQPCEGVGIQTNRRRAAPIDECIPCIAAFFDCRVWQERAEGSPFRYIFFGLRGDVSAAQYLYELVERAFETETDNFRASEIYLCMAGERRTATNSFQTGLARGIAEKLHASRAARDSVMRSASGRDLVPMKTAMVDEEMEKLGLSLTSRVLSRGKRVLGDAYEAGQAAGERFQYTPAITKAA